MANLKARGFDNPAQLREHLDDIVESDNVAQGAQFENDEEFRIKEVAWLRKEVSDLRLQLDVINGRGEMSRSATVEAEVPWLKIVGAVAFTYVLARVAQL
jgi:hypothetical protein